MKKHVGNINEATIKALNLSIKTNTPIYIGDSNERHMKRSHPKDYEKYRTDLEMILSAPDYVGLNPKDQSIEYVKEYKIDDDFVKVAVRVSQGGTYYARSLYVLNNNRVNNFIAKGTLIKIINDD